MKNILLQSVETTEVVVPPKKALSLNSEFIHQTGSTFVKSSRMEFPVQPKWIIEIEVQNGLIGIGETYRSASKELKVATRIVYPILSDIFGEFVREDDLITQHKTT